MVILRVVFIAEEELEALWNVCVKAEFFCLVRSIRHLCAQVDSLLVLFWHFVLAQLMCISWEMMPDQFVILEH